MKFTPIVAACLVAGSLVACGGGGESSEFQGPEFTLSKDELAVAAAEEKFAKMAAEGPESVSAEAPATCEPGTCPSLPADAFDVVGKDLVLEATDPSSTLPNGKAWLSMKSPPAGTPLPAVVEPKVPPIETMLTFNPAKPAAPAAAADGRASAQGLVAGVGAKVVSPKSGARPQRVKVFMHFRNAAGVMSNRVCSGTLIDSQWVLTAAHCLFSHDNGFGYAKVVTISPGFEDGKHPHGKANNAGVLLVAKGWVDGFGGGQDVGWFQLTRPIGGLTGWHNYSAMPAGNFALSEQFLNGSYPADATVPFPGNPPLVPNGQRMWETKFNFDRSLGGGSHYELDYPLGGGASGSGAVHNAGCVGFCFGGNVMAIFERKGPIARYNALTPAHISAISNSIQQTSNLAGVDLAPASVRVVTATKDSLPASDSSPVTEFNVNESAYLVAYIHNNSFTNFKGNLNVSLYLSTNETISTVDKPVRSFTINNFSVNAKESLAISPQFNIPCARTDGQQEQNTMYLGVIINNKDANNYNNDSSGQFVPAAIKIKGACTLTLPVGHGTLNP